MAISWTDTASWATSGTAGSSVSYKDVTVTVAVDDLVVVVAISADASGAGVAAIVTQAGPGTTGSWTIGRSSNVASNCGFVMGHAVATGAGSITVRASVPNSTPGSLPMGSGVWVIPAAEYSGTPAYTNLGPTDADGKVNVTTSGTSSVFYGAGDWSAAGAPGASATPSGVVVDNQELISGNYGQAAYHWSGIAATTQAYGPSAPPGNEFVGAVMAVTEVAPPPIDEGATHASAMYAMLNRGRR